MATWSKSDLRKFFHESIRTLRSHSVPPIVFEYLKEAYGVVISTAYGMRIHSDRIPFIPVIPRQFIPCSPYELATMMHCGVKKGGSIEMEMDSVADIKRPPYIPYFIFDVADGCETLGMSPVESLTMLGHQERRGLTAMEVVALATHTDVLSKCNVYALDSVYYCDERKRMLGIDLRAGDDGYPVLQSNDHDLDQDLWGTPSCSLETVSQHPSY